MYKYKNEIHCNEVSLLAYYVATLCIESKFVEKIKHHKTFEKIVHQDTLDNVEFEGTSLVGTQDSKKQNSLELEHSTSINDENIKRRKEQSQSKMTVIIGNPPYNVNENSKGREYETIDKRIKETYLLESLSTGEKKSQKDMYVRFFRWASDRIKDKGVLSFVTNSSFLDSKSFDGFRISIGKEFDFVYVIDLGGDVNKYLSDPNISISSSNNNVFGIQAGVCISFLIKTGQARKENHKVQIKYVHPFEITELKTSKLDFLSVNIIKNLFDNKDFEEIEPNPKGYWLET